MQKVFNYIQASEMLGIHRRTLERLVAAGEIAVRRIGRRVLFHRDDLAEYLERVRDIR